MLVGVEVAPTVGVASGDDVAEAVEDAVGVDVLETGVAVRVTVGGGVLVGVSVDV